MRKFLKGLNSDRGESLVSVLIVMPLLVVMLVTMVDFSVYILNQGQVRAAARDAARTVAIYGGNGTSSGQITPIAKAYGTIESCPNHTSAECSLIRKLDKDSALVHSQVKDVQCTPSIATKIGQNVHCDVTVDCLHVFSSPAVSWCKRGLVPRRSGPRTRMCLVC